MSSAVTGSPLNRVANRRAPGRCSSTRLSSGVASPDGILEAFWGSRVLDREVPESSKGILKNSRENGGRGLPLVIELEDTSEFAARE